MRVADGLAHPLDGFEPPEPDEEDEEDEECSYVISRKTRSVLASHSASICDDHADS